MNHLFRSGIRLASIAILMICLASTLSVAQSPNCQPGTSATGLAFFVSVDRQTRVDIPGCTPQSPAYAVGEPNPTIYSISGAPPNSPIFWSSTLNGRPTGENQAYYGQNTDANGYWSAAGGAWTTALLGNWVKTATVGGNSVSVAFTVTPYLTLSGGSAVSVRYPPVPTYQLVDAPTYNISGAPANAPIYWSSTLNGQSTGEVNVYYGQNTDGNGNWSATGGTWSSVPNSVGAWTKTAAIGSPDGPRVTAGFQVISSCSIFPATGAVTGHNSYSDHTGAYDWPDVRCLLDDAANRIANIGGHILHMVLASNCAVQDSLSAELQTAEVQQALSNPNLTTIVLTVSDRTACPNNTQIYVDPALYPNSGVVNDYQGLTQSLYQQFHDSGKTFIISNWEGDNVVYCGLSYAYATDTVSRAACDTNYPVLYKGVANPNTSMTGFANWLQARKQGIDQGTSWAASAGLTNGIQVLYAVEFNITHVLQDGGFESVLNNILNRNAPQVSYDFASYSAYETTNLTPCENLVFQGTPCMPPQPQTTGDVLNELSSRVQSDLGLIRNQISFSSNLLIGEFGYSQDNYSPQQIRQLTDDVLNTAISQQVPYTFQWTIFDNKQFGLYDFAGQPQPMACYFEQALGGNPNPLSACN